MKNPEIPPAPFFKAEIEWQRLSERNEESRNPFNTAITLDSSLRSE
ncbi:MAG: hypothetical protein GX121_02825 [Ignavibacteria bacterium]|nr:hypothetical protein [Ignavibacteria bacterium]